MPSEGEELLNQLLESLVPELGYPAFQREFRFHKRRRWRFDFAFPAEHLAIEYEGSWHRTKERFAPDMDKYNTAQILGWRVIRFGRKQLNDGRAEKQIRAALGQNIPRFDRPLAPGERKFWVPGVYSSCSDTQTDSEENHATSEESG